MGTVAVMSPSENRDVVRDRSSVAEFGSYAADRPLDGATGSREIDARLIARIVVGDDFALAELYDRYSALVYGLARRVTQSVHGAEDITQDVFATLWEMPDRFDGARGSLRSFLGVLAHRRSVDWVRREVASRARAERESKRSITFSADTDETVVADDIAIRVRAAVDALPQDQRDAVKLAYFGGLTYREVAEHLAIPEGTAKFRLRLALAKLSATLQAQGITA